MITLDLVRGAVLSPDPAGELDRVVRGELVRGRTTAEVFAALLPVACEIRKTSPLPEDADQVLLGTLDALTGNCNPDECYQDSPAPAPVGTSPTAAAGPHPAPLV